MVADAAPSQLTAFVVVAADSLFGQTRFVKPFIENESERRAMKAVMQKQPAVEVKTVVAEASRKYVSVKQPPFFVRH